MTIRKGKPVYVRLARMSPGTHDHNIIVKVMGKKTLVDKTSADGRKLLEELVTVADNTGCMYLHARDGQCAKLIPGQVVALHNAKVSLVSNAMRLSIGRWGSIQETFKVIPGEIDMEINFSEKSYEMRNVTAAKQTT